MIAGSETIHQGPVNPLDSLAISLKEDILVNSIFAGSQTLTVPNFGGVFCGGFNSPFCPNPNPEPPVVDPKPNPIFLEWKEMAEAGGG